MSILAIVPARRGSKSIPDKNVVSFRGRPLLVHSIEHGLRARNVDRVLVSTDSPRYREMALAAGAEAPFLRPEALAGDLSTDLEVFTHALEWLRREEGYRPEACVHLRPTYPTRRTEDVEKAVALLLADPAADSVRSVARAPHTPYKMWRIAEGGTMRPLLDPPGPRREPWSLPRQALPDVYMQNAAVDVVRTAVVLDRRSMTGTRVLAYTMDRFEDVDDWSDLAALDRGFPEGELPTGLTFAFDLDGVLATLVPGNDYRRAEPCTPGIALANRLHDAGNRIVVYTARGSATGHDWTETTCDQLRRWGVAYHELRFGKPAADYYVDDRMVSPATLQAWVESCSQGHGRKSA
ncbi:MAG TPA: acylneuraminate cytidylyltransferase family protein [Vicinamibacteria bacterium]|nr:acylneuraminate cytidylyltransferase family protein [Vicinamibacteria bacterium]